MGQWQESGGNMNQTIYWTLRKKNPKKLQTSVLSNSAGQKEANRLTSMHTDRSHEVQMSEAWSVFFAIFFSSQVEMFWKRAASMYKCWHRQRLCSHWSEDESGSAWLWWVKLKSRITRHSSEFVTLWKRPSTMGRRKELFSLLDIWSWNWSRHNINNYCIIRKKISSFSTTCIWSVQCLVYVQHVQTANHHVDDAFGADKKMLNNCSEPDKW